jgi:hypothetical protein
MSHVIRSGDQIEILTSKKQRPKEEWLSIVVTASARQKIKVALKEERKKIAEEGKALLRKFFQNIHADWLAVNIDELVKHFEYEMMKVGNSIFDIASNNRFYSKLYADLYAVLINRYEIIKTVFEKSFNTFLELFQNIEHVNPEEDYNKFVKINEENEKRKALSSFFVNLMSNGIITKEKIIEITCDLMDKVLNLIKEENKKSVVDEITENISLLYNKDIFEKVRVNDELFVDIINKLSLCKVKTYPSLSNKSIFKYMDLNEL